MLFNKRVSNGRLWDLLIPLVLIGAGFIACIEDISFVTSLRNLVFDTYQRAAPRERSAEMPVRIIDIDDESLAKIGQWPWPRSVLAKLSDKLAEQGAIAVGYDILFSEPDRLSPENIIAQLPDTFALASVAAALENSGPSNDKIFAEALEKLPSVLGFAATAKASSTVPPKGGIAFGGADPRGWMPNFAGAVLPIAALAQSKLSLGSIVFLPDRDLIVRKVNLLFNIGQDAATGIISPSLDAALLRDAQGASTLIVKSSDASGNLSFGVDSGITEIRIGAFVVPTDRTGAVRIHFARTDPGRRIPAWKLLSGGDLRQDIEGRIMLVGSSATALADIRSTPLDAVVPGIDIHAELLENIIDGVHLVRPDYVSGLEAIMLISGSLAGLVLTRFASAFYSTLGILTISIAYWAGSFLAFRHAGLLIDPLVPVATMISAFGVATIAQFRRTERARREIRGAFSRYVAPGVIANLEKNPQQLRLGGEIRSVSVMFCDARNFTTRSETLDGAGVVHFLNSLHTPLTAHVLGTDGTIDKYIGDGLMAFWNAPHHVPDHASKSCAAALRMMASVPLIDEKLRQEAQAEGRPHVPLAIGIGINTGASFVGNMGSDQRFDYSVVGDTVNVAARFESATKEYGVDIIVSAKTAEEAAMEFIFVELEGLKLKGKSEPVQALALHGPRPRTADLDLDTFLDLHRSALQATRDNSPEARWRIEAASAHPYAAPYHTLYALWKSRMPIELEHGVQAGS